MVDKARERIEGRSGGLKKSILISTAYFVPGSKGGGPIRSLDAMTAESSPDADFFVITGERDLGQEHPYPGISSNSWTRQSSRHIWYKSRDSWRGHYGAIKAIRELRPDVYYFNSLWSIEFSLAPLVLIGLGALPRAPIVLAPRGELLPEALRRSQRKKQLMFPMVSRLLAHLRVTIHSTSAEETVGVSSRFPRLPIIEHGDLFPPITHESIPEREDTPELKLVYASRVHPHKNLATVLEALKAVVHPVALRVAGDPQEVPDYAAHCRDLVGQLPPHVSVEFLGHVEREGVDALLAWGDAFILPTRSENFGHAIREAMSTGCIPLISNSTPWNDVIDRIGLPTLDWRDTTGFAAMIERIAQLDDVGRRRLRHRTFDAYTTWEQSHRAERFFTIQSLVSVAESYGRP